MTHPHGLKNGALFVRHALPLLLLWGCSLNVSGINVSRGGHDGGTDGAWTGGTKPEATTAGSGGVLGSGGALTTAGTLSGGGLSTSFVDSGGAPATDGTTRDAAPDPVGGTTAAGGGSWGRGGIDDDGGVALVGGSLGSGGATGGRLGGTSGVDAGLDSTGKDGSGGTGGVPASGGTSMPARDASADRAAGCVFGPFQAPELITGLGLSDNDSLWAPSLASDGKTLYFAASGLFASEDLYVATRLDRGSVFSTAVALDSVNTPWNAEGTPCISNDGLTLYLYSDRAGGVGGRDIWLASRPTDRGAFGPAKLLAAVNGIADDHVPWVSADGLTLILSVGSGDLSDLYIATRGSRTADFASPAPLDGINGAATREDRAALSSDGLTIYYTSNRPGGLGGKDTWVGTRSRSDGSFGSFTNLAVANSTEDDMDVTLSRDGTELLFVSNRSGTSALYRSVRDCW